MKRYKAFRWIITMSCVVVSLMGISYAYFGEKLTISSKIQTANMKYSFSDGGNILNITLDSEVTLKLLNLAKDEIYTLEYSLKSNDKNVPLKKIVDKHIGSISIDLEDVISQDSNEVKVSSIVNNSIPDSIGTFDCYHDFDGVNGTITLIKQTEPTNLNIVINKEDLTVEEQKQLGIEETLVERIIVDNTIANKELETEGKDLEKIQLDQTIQTVDTIQIQEELKERAVINIEATYGFEIPLVYDQFNGKVN